MFWPFNRKRKKQAQLPELPEPQMYVLAEADGVVDLVQTGLVRVSGIDHTCQATLVLPGESVTKGQPVGKK